MKKLASAFALTLAFSAGAVVSAKSTIGMILTLCTSMSSNPSMRWSTHVQRITTTCRATAPKPRITSAPRSASLVLRSMLPRPLLDRKLCSLDAFRGLANSLSPKQARSMWRISEPDYPVFAPACFVEFGTRWIQLPPWHSQHDSIFSNALAD